MNEKTKAVISEDLVDIYYGNDFVGAVYGQVAFINRNHESQENYFVLRIKMDGHYTGVIIADVIQKGDS